MTQVGVCLGGLAMEKLATSVRRAPTMGTRRPITLRRSHASTKPSLSIVSTMLVVGHRGGRSCNSRLAATWCMSRPLTVRVRKPCGSLWVFAFLGWLLVNSPHLSRLARDANQLGLSARRLNNTRQPAPWYQKKNRVPPQDHQKVWKSPRHFTTPVVLQNPGSPVVAVCCEERLSAVWPS